MNAAGVNVDKEELAAFFKVLGDKSVVDSVKAGSKKLVAMPAGGAAAAPSAGGAAAAEAPKEEEKKEEEEDVDMGGLFGDDDEY